MAKKNKHSTPIRKVPSTPLASIDVTQIQALLEQYRPIAQSLSKSTNQEQVEVALTPYTSLPEATQIALLKTLSREQHEDAADVLLALNQFSPLKEVRKEARRSLIRLQEMHIYPQWQPPVKQTALSALLEEAENAGNPPRFWKGRVTNSRDVGEVSLVLLWEQGENYREVRVLAFLLDFWTEGVKDFFTMVESKRSSEKLLGEMAGQTEVVDCSLIKARSLIRDALAVHEKFGTKPYRDYSSHLSLINKLILEAPELIDEPEPELDALDTSLLGPSMEPKVIVTGFIQAAIDRDFKLAYALLAKNSELSEGLPAVAWIDRRTQWASQANPHALQPGPVEELEPKKSKLWLPSSASRGNQADQKEISVFWSMSMDTTATDIALPEWPRASTFYKENKRYWFWAIFTVVKEEENWRIQNMSDAGAATDTLSIKEVESRIKAEDKAFQEITTHHSPSDPDASHYLEELILHNTKALHYADALITKLPLDEKSYITASQHALQFGNIERALSYMERMLELSPKNRATVLREIGSLQAALSEAYYQLEDETEDEDEDENVVDSELSQGDKFYHLAKASMEASLEIDHNPSTQVMLAKLIIDFDREGEELDEAEDHLLQAETGLQHPKDLAVIESYLAQIDFDREQYEHSLRHYQQALEHDPDSSLNWNNLGRNQKALGNIEESIQAFNKAIELDPKDENNYADLGRLYTENSRVAEARATLERGIQAVPDPAPLLVFLSITFIEDDPQHAEELLKQAEGLNPDMEMVQMYRQMFNSVIEKPQKKNQRRKKFTMKKSKKR